MEHKAILVRMPADVLQVLTMRSRRFGVSRSALVRGLCSEYAGRSMCAPHEADVATLGEEVQQMFEGHTHAEAPRYGERTRRHFNKSKE